jgi:ketosteroid isomerase-like protein
MQRRHFLAGSGALIASVSTPHLPAADDEAAVKEAIKNDYAVFSEGRDKKKYRSLLTDDYLLLENGELLDIEGDIALMHQPDPGYKRTDAFDFRSVKVHGDFAYVVYSLQSEITDSKNGTRNRRWLESAILRRSGQSWLIALLHSTRIAQPTA